jgi:hypothetical protein
MQSKNRPLPPTPVRRQRSALLQRGNSVAIVNDVAQNAPSSAAEECSALTAKYNAVKDATELTFIKQQEEISRNMPEKGSTAQQTFKRVLAMNRGINNMRGLSMVSASTFTGHLLLCLYHVCLLSQTLSRVRFCICIALIVALSDRVAVYSLYIAS